MREIGEAGDALAGAGGVLDHDGALGMAGFGEQRADAVEMTADLDDGGGRGGGEFGAEGGVVERGGQDFQHFVAGGERAADGGSGGGERGDSRDDLDRGVGADAGDEVHGRAIEQRIAFAQPGDIAAGAEMGEDGFGGGIVGGLRRAALDRHRDGDGEADGGGVEVGAGDFEGERRGFAGGRIGDDRDGAEEARGLQGQ